MTKNAASSLEEASVDVAIIDCRRFGHKLDVADIDFPYSATGIDVAHIDSGRIAPKSDVTGVENAMASCAMQKDEDAPDVEVVPAARTDDAQIVTRDEPLPPVVPDPATLIRGFRLLAERIPGFQHLSKEKVRSMIRVSELDPEMIAAGLVAAEVWPGANFWMHMTAEELRVLDTTIGETDAVIEQMKILLDGMIGANRVRKHQRGKAILMLYKGLEIEVEGRLGDNRLRPYFENMRRAYMKNRKRRKAKAEAVEPKE